MADDIIEDIPVTEQPAKRRPRPMQMQVNRALQCSFLTEVVYENADGDQIGDAERVGELDCSTMLDKTDPDDAQLIALMKKKFKQAWQERKAEINADS